MATSRSHSSGEDSPPPAFHYVPMSQLELDKKAQRHRTMQQRRFAKKATVSNPEQINMPPEMLRKIIRDHGDMSNRKFRNDKRVHLGALKYGECVRARMNRERERENLSGGEGGERSQLKAGRGEARARNQTSCRTR